MKYIIIETSFQHHIGNKNINYQIFWNTFFFLKRQILFASRKFKMHINSRKKQNNTNRCRIYTEHPPKQTMKTSQIMRPEYTNGQCINRIPMPHNPKTKQSPWSPKNKHSHAAKTKTAHHKLHT